MDRSDACYDTAASVVVRTTDSCPCNFADNYYSNKRWCCGDMDHFDLSIWAFEKLADTKWGVMGIQYRAVPCSYQPAKVAPEPENPFPGEEPPPGTKRTDRWDSEASTDVEEQQSAQLYKTDDVFMGGRPTSWKPASWYAKMDDSQAGLDGGKASCAKVSSSGALAFEAPKGRFDGKISLQMWIKTDAGVPEINVNLSGSGKSCRAVRIQDMNQSGQRDGWSRYDLYLGLFAPAAPDAVVSFTPAFKGCGSASAAELERIEIKNDKPYEQSFCVDDVKLVGA